DARLAVLRDRLVAGPDMGVERYRLRRERLLDIPDADETRHRDQDYALGVDRTLELFDLAPRERRLRIFEVEDRRVAALQALLEGFPGSVGRGFLSAEIGPVDRGMDRDLAVQNFLHHR